MIGWIRSNFRTLLLLGVGYWGLVQLGAVDAPNLPEWWPLAALLVGSVAIVGWIVGGKIAALLPDPIGTIVVAMDADDARGGAIYELNDEAWMNLRVVKGELFEWEGSSVDVYECREFRPEEMVAVANWKGTKTGSELSTPVERAQVMSQIATLRRDHEEQARYGEAIRQSIPALLRRLDKQRAMGLNAALEGHISPSIGGESIDDMIRSQLPEEVLPDYMTEEDDAGGVEDGPVASLDLLDDAGAEALEPIGPLRNDGGTEHGE